jgi:hypothetical protein
MNKKIWAAAALVLVVLVAFAVLLTGFGSSATSAFDASSVSCTDVGNQVTTTNASIAQDQKDVTDGQETPKASEATDRLNADNYKLTLLNTRLQTCGVASTSTTADKAAQNKVIVTAGLQNAGFDPKTFEVNPPSVDAASAAQSTGGPGSFSTSYIDSPTKAVDFLQSGTPAAQAALTTLEKSTGSTQSELEDVSNWALVQFSGTKVQWNGNSGFSNNAVSGTTASSVDPAGTVGLFFVPPEQVQAGTVSGFGVLRGACGNPQFAMPTPPGTTPPPSQAPITTQAPVVTHVPVTTQAPATTAAPSPTTSSTCDNCSIPTTAPAPSQCNCVSPTRASQDVVDRGSPVEQHVGPVAGSPTSRPTPPPVGPAPAPSQAAPAPTPGGYSSGGGTGTSPGGSQCDPSGCTGGGSPSPTGAPATPVPSATNTGNPGGF